MSKIPNELWEYAKQEFEKLEYGEVRIIANETSRGVDVIVENRKRFKKNEGRLLEPTEHY